MEENVRKELDTLEQMVLNWKRNYLGFITPEGGDEFLVEEFAEEIATHVSPFVERLYACDHLSKTEVGEFLEVCYKHVEELRNALLAAETKQKGLWQKFVDAVGRK